MTAMNLIVAMMKLSAAKPLHAWVRIRGNGRLPRLGGWDDELVETTENSGDWHAKIGQGFGAVRYADDGRAAERGLARLRHDCSAHTAPKP
jgi:hypothetical protein